MTHQINPGPDQPTTTCKCEVGFWRWIFITYVAGAVTVLSHFFVGPVMTILCALATLGAVCMLYWHIHRLSCNFCRDEDENDDDFQGGHPLPV